MNFRPDHSHSPRRWLWFLFIFLILIVGSGWWFYLHDEAPPNDDDLLISVHPVPEAKNGLAQLGKLPLGPVDFTTFAKSRGVTDDGVILRILSGQTRQDPLVDAFLAQAQPVFKQLDADLALPYFQNPPTISLDIKFPEIAPTLAISKALRLAVIREMQQSDFPGAVRDTLRLRLLASRLTESYAYLVQYITANTVYGFSAQSARDLLNAPGLPTVQLLTLSHAYAVNEPAMAAFQRTLTMEYQFSVAALNAEATQDALYKPKSPDSGWGDRLGAFWLHFTLKPNATRHQLSDFYRDWRSIVNGPYADIDFNTLNARRLNMQQGAGRLALVTWVLAPNTGGRYFLAISAGAPDIVKYPYWEVAVDRMLRTGFAMRLYYTDHGMLPLYLDNLVPDYLANLPKHPFDGAPLHYDRNRSLIYSVGTAMKDTDGSAFTSAPPTTPDYVDPLMDLTQPTLALTFHKPPR